MRSRFAVASVGLVGVLAAACTRDNPAFGGEGTDGGKDDDATDPSADDDDDDDDSADDDGSEAETSNVDDGPDTGVVDEGPLTDMGPVSTSGGVCEVFPPVGFDVKAMDENLAMIDPVCGGPQAWHGAVLTAVENELTIEVCPENTCECGADVGLVTLTFEDLAPSPVDAIANIPEACVAVMVTRRVEADACTVAFIVVEQIDVQAEFPLYIATSSADPDWGLTVPVAQLADPLDVCEGQDCEGMAPGEYSMLLGDLGPLAPGESGHVTLNPYAGPETTYEVTDLFSRIDDACEPALGWAGIPVP